MPRYKLCALWERGEQFEHLAAGRQVRVADSAADHVAALETAARREGFGAQLRAEARDLGRRPLLGDELAELDAVVLDPPRPGAPQQAKALAASSVPTVAYVSCNPASLARDARVLPAGGSPPQAVRPPAPAGDRRTMPTRRSRSAPTGPPARAVFTCAGL